MKDKSFCDSLSCKLRSVSPPWIGSPPQLRLFADPASRLRSSLAAARETTCEIRLSRWSCKISEREKKKFPFQWKTGHGWFFPGLMLSARTQIPSPVALSNTPIYKTTILGTEQHIHDYFLLGILITQGIELPASEIWSNNVKQKLVMQNVPLEII